MRRMLIPIKDAKEIADLVQAADKGDGNLEFIAHGIRNLVGWSGVSGYVVLTTAPKVQGKKGVPWTEKEEKKLVQIMKGYMGRQDWEEGQPFLGWGEVAEAMERPIGSVKTKYRELKRRGRL